MESFIDVWNLVCHSIREQISDVAFNSWFERIEPVSLDLDQKIATIKLPNDFHRRIVSQNYNSMIVEAFEKVLGEKIHPMMITAEDDITECAPGDAIFSGPDYSYTFGTFIVGPSNRFAHAASQAVAEQPAAAYNPLFIYGNSGLGKTHLLYAICNYIYINLPNANIIYVKGDQFTNELIEAVRHNTQPEFRNKYRLADILLVDDIQFIGGKTQTQEEFFHTFNHLYEAKKQIVLTSDRPPKEILTLEDRLRTRFESGLLADIQPPDIETRIAILQRKAELLDIKIEENVCEFIATRLKSNIRQLEGAVKKLKAYYLLQGELPVMSTAQRAISDILNNEQSPPVTVNKIIEEVARTYGVTAVEIRSVKRSAKISIARQVAIYVVREITQMPMVSIGEEFGGRDHSTVSYGIQQIERNMQTDFNLKATVEDLIKNIRAC